MSRADKMYKNSPKIGKDESGKPKVSREEAASAETNAGTEGVVKGDDESKKMLDRHAMERLKLHQEHEKEHLALAQKYKTTGATAGDDGEKGE